MIRHDTELYMRSNCEQETCNNEIIQPTSTEQLVLSLYMRKYYSYKRFCLLGRLTGVSEGRNTH